MDNFIGPGLLGKFQFNEMHLSENDIKRGAYNRTSGPAVRQAKIYLVRPRPAAILRLHRLPV